MSLERGPAHLGDIGDGEPEEESDPDRVSEKEIERQLKKE